VLTRWGARAPARGPATAPKLAPVFLARGCSAVTVSAAAEKRQAARRERGEEPKWLGYSRAPAAAWFLIHAKRPLVRRIRSNARDALGQVEAQAGASARRGLPAQAQVAAWVRPGRARGCWAEPVQRVLGRAGLKNERRTRNFFLIIFQKQF